MLSVRRPSLTHDGERVWEHLVEGRAPLHLVTQLGCSGRELIVRAGLNSRLARVDFSYQWSQAFEVALVLGAEDLREEGVDEHLGR